jgi:hypothetical protein
MARPSDDDDLARRVANLKEREDIDPNHLTYGICSLAMIETVNMPKANSI